MTKSELIERLATQQPHIPAKAVEDAVKEMLEHMASTLAQGERIEIRGFGSFSLHYRAPRTGRNPKTGDKVDLEGKYVPITETVRGFKEILEGKHDDIPESYFLNAGTIDEVREKYNNAQ